MDSNVSKQSIIDHSLTSVLNDPNSRRFKPKERPIVPPKNWASQQDITVKSFRDYITALKKGLPQTYQQQSDYQQQLVPSITSNSIRNEIPSMFFNQNFSLANPSTFKAIQESEPSNVLLQQKLSNYVDSVEIELCKQVSEQSANVFQALDNLQWFQQELLTTVSTNQNLRSELTTLYDIHVKNIFRMMQLKNQRNNLEAILDKLQLITTIKNTMPTIDLLLDNKDFRGALDVLATVEDAIKGDLHGFLCFRKMHTKIREKREAILQLMTSAFLEESLHPHSTDNQSEIFNWKNTESSINHSLASIIRELFTLAHLTKTMVEYRDAVHQKLVSLMKTSMLQVEKLEEGVKFESVIVDMEVDVFLSR